MTEQELHEALNGLSAYDMGSLQSGIHDEELRQRALTQVKAMDGETLRLFLSRHLRFQFLDESALSRGYGYEDAQEFLEWLSGQGVLL